MRRIPIFAAMGLALFLLTAGDLGAQRPVSGEKFRKAGRPIPNQYIVVLRDDIPASKVAATAHELVQVKGGRIGHVYRYALKGFSATLTEEEAIALSRLPEVDLVEEDGIAAPALSQLNPPWQLDRIDQRNLPLDGVYTYNEFGSGVNVYIIDTGVRTSHVDFGGRAFFAVDTLGGNGGDCAGHGTQVAGLAGGSTYGVAKGVSLYNVRACNCNNQCPHSNWIAGIDWVTSNHVKPAVANQSLGTVGGPSTAIDKATRRSIAAGVTHVVCAHNSNIDASSFSPARVTQAITVGATGDDLGPVSDQRASFSNFGSVLDLFAPGVKTPSASPFNDTATDPNFGGTSAASPQVAGAAARYLQTDPTSCPSTVSDVLASQATAGVVIDPGAGSPNRLLFTPLSWPAPTFRSLSLNGTGAAVDVLNNSGSGVSLNITGPLTVEAWVQINNTAATQAIVTRYTPFSLAGTFDGGYALKVISGGRARFWIYKNGAELDRITSTTTLVPGVWYHLAGVYDGSRLLIYVNGVLEASKVPANVLAEQTVNLRIGSNFNGEDPFNGLIDEVRVTAAAVYNGSFTPKNRLTGVPETKGLWRFDRQDARDCADVNNGVLVGGAAFSTTVP